MELQQKQQQQSTEFHCELPKTSLPSQTQHLEREKTYHGVRRDGNCVVWVNEAGVTSDAKTEAESSRPLPMRLELRNHSPTGFEWGYGGSGPAQLALALLMDATGDRTLALRHYQDFKFQFVAGWGDSWNITSQEIKAFLLARESLAGCECAVNSCPDC